MDNITIHRTFLENLVRNKNLLKSASDLEVSVVVEILDNGINTGFNLTKTESKIVAKNLILIRKILKSKRPIKICT